MTGAGEPVRRPGRWEWERVVRRIVMPKADKLTALVLATYADPDGSRVRPGLELLAAETDQSTRNAKRIMARLLELHLIEQVSRGGGRGGAGRATEYRLTIPEDLIERVELVPLNGRPDLAAVEESGDTQMSPQSEQSPVDKSVDQSAEPLTANANDGTYDTAIKPIEGTFSTNEGTPRCPPTRTRDQTTLTRTPVVTNQGESRPRANARDPPHRTRTTVHNRPP